MSHSQPWPLSQVANKSKGVCSVCFNVRQLHHSTGSVHLHGPRRNPCRGSNKPPISSAFDLSATSSPSGRRLPSLPASQPQTRTCPLNSSRLNTVTPCAPNTKLTSLSHPSFAHPIIKHIPKSVRGSCARCLGDLFNKLMSHPNDLDLWDNLLNFGGVIFAKPEDKSEGSLSKTIKTRLSAYAANPRRTSPSTYCKNSDVLRSNSKCPDELLAKSITSKIEDGNIRAAVRILTSDDSVAANDATTFAKLLDKHPPAHSEQNFTSLPNGPYSCSLQVTEQEVLKAARSFPSGSAGGPDGIRPQHLVDMLSCKDSLSLFLSNLTKFVNFLLRGQCPETVAPSLFGGTLIAIQKKDGGVRPIAIGYLWRRLAAKCANTAASLKLSDYLQPRQLGVGVKGGCEAAVHACRRFMGDMKDNQIIVKLDFANAFNSLRRDVILSAVFQNVPELLPFCYSAYRNVSMLKFGQKLVPSQEGIQQGDPLGPLLFCLTIQPILQNLVSELVIGYMDDITIGGSGDVVAKDVSSLEAACKLLGLNLNPKKCELIAKSNQLPPIDLPGMDDFAHVPVEGATLLGAPLMAGQAMDESLTFKLTELQRGAQRLPLISAHDALVLMRASGSASKLNYLLRASPCTGHAKLNEIDNLFRNSLSQVCNVTLSDRNWSQASLPVKYGGLGIRSVADLAPACFLSSIFSTKTIQDNLLDRCYETTAEDIYKDKVLAEWLRTTSSAIPVAPSVGSQRSWDAPLSDLTFQTLLNSSNCDTEKARLLAAAAPHSGDWLHALPISSCGLRLENDAVRVAVGFRLGVKVCEPHNCPCGSVVDGSGSHALSCKTNTGKTLRHTCLNDVIARALTRAGVPSTKEPAGLSRSDGKRPDGITLLPWKSGKAVIWDVTVADTLAASYISSSAIDAGSAAEKAANKKIQKYLALSTDHIFVPLAFESLGPLCHKATTFLNEIGSRAASVTDDRRETAFLFQRISVVIQRFNSIMLGNSFLSPQADED